MANSFYISVHDNKNRKYENVGPMTDDTLITHNISFIQKINENINCQTVDHANSPCLPGYEKEDNLYRNLIENYNQVTGENLKLW